MPHSATSFRRAVRLDGTGSQGSQYWPAALAHLAAQGVQGIVLDRRLPDDDGVDRCRLLRQHVDRGVPIIFVTADRDAALESAAREAGITELLLKPFHPPDLRARQACCRMRLLCVQHSAWNGARDKWKGR